MRKIRKIACHTQHETHENHNQKMGTQEVAININIEHGIKGTRAMTVEEMQSTFKQYNAKLLSRWSPTRSYFLRFNPEKKTLEEDVMEDGKHVGTNKARYSFHNNSFHIHYEKVVPSPYLGSTHHPSNPASAALGNVNVGQLRVIIEPKNGMPSFVAYADYPNATSAYDKSAAVYTFYKHT